VERAPDGDASDIAFSAELVKALFHVLADRAGALVQDGKLGPMEEAARDGQALRLAQR
jgi:hypothetical protein